MIRILILLASHGAALGLGFALGIYLLPILTAPPSPEASVLEEKARAAVFTGTFTRDLEGSDFAHWGEGTISLTPTEIIHEGTLAPGPDYKLYLLKDFVETEEAFLALKDQAVRIGDVKSFDGFVVRVPDGVSVADYRAVVIWCEAFSEFITAASYQH